MTRAFRPENRILSIIHTNCSVSMLLSNHIQSLKAVAITTLVEWAAAYIYTHTLIS